MARPEGGARSRIWPTTLAGGWPAAVAATAIALVSLAGAISDAPVSPFLRDLPPWLGPLAIAAGSLLVAAAWAAVDERPAAVTATAVATAGLLMPAWAGWTPMPDAAQAAALAVAPLAVAGAAGVGLGWSRNARPTRSGRVVLVLALAAVAVRLAGYDPFADPGCARTCVHVAPPLAGQVTSRTAFAAAAGLELAAAVAAAVALLRVASGRPRSVIGASLVAALLLPVPDVAQALAWSDPLPPATAVLPALVAGLLLGAAPLVALAAARRTRLEVRELVDALGAAGSPGRPGGGMVRAVAFAVPDDGRWVDAAGRPVEDAGAAGRGVLLSDAVGPAFRLEVARGADASGVLATITPATLLALRNARLAALRSVRLAEVRASQRRIVATSDAARQRIERDLHDGAQQRLVSVSLQLGIAKGRLPAGGLAAERVAAAEERVRDALERLRQLGHGIFPAALEAEGLGAALEDLARASDVDVRLDLPPLELERDVALAAYAVVDAAIAEARAAGRSTTVRVSAAVEAATARLRVELDGPCELASASLVEASDRVGAVGGRLVVYPTASGVVVEAEMPCA